MAARDKGEDGHFDWDMLHRAATTKNVSITIYDTRMPLGDEHADDPLQYHLQAALSLRLARLAWIGAHNRLCLEMQASAGKAPTCHAVDAGILQKSKIRVDRALEGKIRTNRAYREFASAIESACGSTEAESLGITGYALDEKRDFENPQWLKVKLHVQFASGSFEEKRDRRNRLRAIIDGRIADTRRRSSRPELIDGISGRFFITVAW